MEEGFSGREVKLLQTLRAVWCPSVVNCTRTSSRVRQFELGPLMQNVALKTRSLARRNQGRILFRLYFGRLNAHFHRRGWKWDPCEWARFCAHVAMFMYTLRKTVTSVVSVARKTFFLSLSRVWGFIRKLCPSSIPRINITRWQIRRTWGPQNLADSSFPSASLFNSGHWVTILLQEAFLALMID